MMSAYEQVRSRTECTVLCCAVLCGAVWCCSQVGWLWDGGGWWGWWRCGSACGGNMLCALLPCHKRCARPARTTPHAALPVRIAPPRHTALSAAAAVLPALPRCAPAAQGAVGQEVPVPAVCCGAVRDCVVQGAQRRGGPRPSPLLQPLVRLRSSRASSIAAAGPLLSCSASASGCGCSCFGQRGGRLFGAPLPLPWGALGRSMGAAGAA